MQARVDKRTTPERLGPRRRPHGAVPRVDLRPAVRPRRALADSHLLFSIGNRRLGAARLRGQALAQRRAPLLAAVGAAELGRTALIGMANPGPHRRRHAIAIALGAQAQAITD